MPLPLPLLLLLAALAAMAPQAEPRAAERQRQVLAVYSTRRDAQIAIVGERELPRQLEEGLGGRLDYYSEFIDPTRFEDPAYQEALSGFLRLKYQEHRFDAIVAVGNDAAAFVARYRSAFAGFPPVVFFVDSTSIARPPNGTGVVAPLNLAGTADVALALDPQLRHVYLISGADRNDATYDSTARQQLRAVASRVEVQSLAGLAAADLEARLRALPPHSAVYYLVVDRDGTGQNFHPLNYLDRVVAASNAPTYSWVDSALGHGVVGGSVKSQLAQMTALADVALRVVRGEPADTIPVVTRDLNVVEIDWRQLRRWGLDESRVPAAATVLYRDPTAWERYRPYILAALVLLFAQTALITGLLVQRSRRWRAERRVLQREAQLRASYARIRDLGARLLNAQDSERSHIARELHDDVSQQLALIEMDVKLLGGATTDGSAELLGRVQSVARSVRDLSHRLHPAKLHLIGLLAALKGLQAEMSHSGMAIAFTHENVPPSLPTDVTVCLFRVAQEALQNAVKYSRAAHVTLHLAGTGDRIRLTIADDGAGFDVAEAYSRGLGLLSMAERVEAIGGTITVESTPGAGTRVDASIPVAAQKGGVVAV